MKTSDFNKMYEHSKTVNIINDEFLNCAGWFWVNLTETQHKKMYNLMIMQGAKEEVNKGDKIYIKLLNGMMVMKID